VNTTIFKHAEFTNSVLRSEEFEAFATRLRHATESVIVVTYAKGRELNHVQTERLRRFAAGSCER